MRWASALRWPWLVMGSVPPVDSMTISAQNTPVEMCTEAIFDMAMLSSLLPNRRDFTRATRCGLMTRRVGKKKLPAVQRLAAKVSAGEESMELSGREGIISCLNRVCIVPAGLVPRLSGYPGLTSLRLRSGQALG